jgi:energy-coupling factor transporter ATP-binding protein EcfA2
MSDEEEVPPKLIRLAQVSHAFTPAAPIDDASLFADRPNEVFACVQALWQKGLHIALYGERGVGKTSLANVLPRLIKDDRLPYLDGVRVDCNTNDTYRTVWRKVFRALEGNDPNGDLTDPEEVRFRLDALERITLIVLDEFDRLEDDDALSLLADTVKTLSDHATSATLMFVGVAESVDHLLGEHDSIVRSVRQVHMPRMSNTELGAILDKGFGSVELTVTPEARSRIVRMAEGLPHFAHLLGIHGGQVAVQDDRDVVTDADLDRAFSEAVRTHSILSEYQRATQSPQPHHLFEEVLLACAFAPRNELGYFRAGDIREPLSMIMGEEMSIPRYQRHLNELSGHSRLTLQKDGEPRHYVYRFRNPLLQPFAKMVGLAKRRITEELRDKLQSFQDGRSAPTLFEQSTLPEGYEDSR